jgi:hypothetical protein
LCGAQICRGQSLAKRIYWNNGVGWGGGLNMTYAFHKYNLYTSVHLTGSWSGYGTANWVYATIRIYSQNAGTYYYFGYQYYINNTYNHMTYPINLTLTPGELGNNTGWFDIYVYNAGNFATDTGDQLNLSVIEQPGSNF